MYSTILHKEHTIQYICNNDPFYVDHHAQIVHLLGKKNQSFLLMHVFIINGYLALKLSKVALWPMKGHTSFYTKYLFDDWSMRVRAFVVVLI